LSVEKQCETERSCIRHISIGGSVARGMQIAEPYRVNFVY